MSLLVRHQDQTNASSYEVRLLWTECLTFPCSRRSEATSVQKDWLCSCHLDAMSESTLDPAVRFSL